MTKPEFFLQRQRYCLAVTWRDGNTLEIEGPLARCIAYAMEINAFAAVPDQCVRSARIDRCVGPAPGALLPLFAYDADASDRNGTGLGLVRRRTFARDTCAEGVNHAEG